MPRFRPTTVKARCGYCGGVRGHIANCKANPRNPKGSARVKTLKKTKKGESTNA